MNAFQKALFTHLLLAVAAGCFTYTTYLLNVDSVQWNYILFVLFAALFIYRLAYYGVPLKLSSLRIVDKIIAIICAAGFSLLVFFDSEIITWLVMCLLACLAYFIRLKNWNGLRSVTFVKSFWLAMVWTIVTALIPLISGNKNIDWIIIGERFTFMLSICIVYNLRDVQHDFSLGVNTMVHRMGASLTKAVCLILLVLNWMMIYHHGYANDIYNALLVSATLTGLTVLLARENGHWMYYTLLVDGSMIVQFLLVLFAVHKAVN